MSARELATKDIMEELEVQGRCFLAFHSELDPIMDALVEEQSQKQLIASII